MALAPPKDLPPPLRGQYLLLVVAALLAMLMTNSQTVQAAVCNANSMDSDSLTLVQDGNVDDTGSMIIEPNGYYYFSSISGQHSATLETVNSTADLDLFLNKWDSTNKRWNKIGSSTKAAGLGEQITVSETPGYFFWLVHAYSGGSPYKLTITRPESNPSVPKIPTPVVPAFPTPKDDTATVIPIPSPAPSTTPPDYSQGPAPVPQPYQPTPIPSPYQPTPQPQNPNPNPTPTPTPSTPSLGGRILGTPLSTAAPSLTKTPHPLAPTNLWDSSLLNKPLPTNEWWENLILAQGEDPIDLLPYMVKVTANAASICYAYPTYRKATAQYILQAFVQNIILGTTETLTGRKLVDYDKLTATVRYTGSGSQTMTLPLVRGSPYVTAEFQSMTPLIKSAHAILDVNGQNPNINPRQTGSKFAFRMNNDQTWMIFTDKDVSLTASGDTITFLAPYTGALRIAIAPTESDKNVLSQYAQTYPVKGSFDMNVIAGNQGSLTMKYQTKGSGSGLLMAVLPHHQDTIVNAQYAGSVLKSIKGDMKTVVLQVDGSGLSNAIQLNFPLTNTTWTSGSSTLGGKKEDIRAALMQDKNKMPVATDPYFFGKQVAAMGRLALIADELNEASVASEIRGRMKDVMKPWLEGSKLTYESTYRGLCSISGLVKPENDFGQGYYNDHHFHYGYHIYAAAVIAKGDPQWLAANKESLTTMLRDICNPTDNDAYFPLLRNFDVFAGHSWAAGLFTFADSRNQESTSEAVNAWYGVYLYGLVSGDATVTGLGKLLLAMEMRAAQKYWHIKSSDTIYEKVFADNKCVGVLWGNKVDYATFFGGQVEFIHGIQMLPFTPITSELLTKDWVVEEYPVISQALTRPTTTDSFGNVIPPVSDAWKGFIYMDHAVIDSATAWEEIKTLKDYDDGNSKTNTMYWVASRLA